MKKIVYARTNAEFLNKTFGTSYKAYMRGRWEYDEETWVWMIRLDNRIRDGWHNRIISENEIWEEYLGNETPTYRGERERKYRIVVSIVENGTFGREYHILGRYRYDAEKSKLGCNVLIKTDDSFLYTTCEERIENIATKILEEYKEAFQKLAK